MKRIFNVQTNPLILPMYKETEVLFEQFEKDPETGRYFKEFRERREPKIEAVVVIDGTPRDGMHDPKFEDVSEENFKLLIKCPGWEGLLKSGKVRYTHLPGKASKGKAPEDN